MTKSKTNDLADQIRVLDDAELTAVSGGYLDNCIPHPDRLRHCGELGLDLQGRVRQADARHLSLTTAQTGERHDQ